MLNKLWWRKRLTKVNFRVLSRIQQNSWGGLSAEQLLSINLNLF